MSIDDAIETISQALTTLAHNGYVCSGELAFIKPNVPGLITSEATFTRSPAPTLRLQTVRASPPSMTAIARETTGFITGDICIKCGGSRMQQAGACKVCLDCGESGGCG
jgi:hypothetical protein